MGSLEHTTAPSGEEPTSRSRRCELLEDQSFIPRVIFIRERRPFHSVPLCELDGWVLQSSSLLPLHASVTFWEAYAP